MNEGKRKKKGELQRETSEQSAGEQQQPEKQIRRLKREENNIFCSSLVVVEIASTFKLHLIGFLRLFIRFCSEAENLKSTPTRTRVNRKFVYTLFSNSIRNTDTTRPSIVRLLISFRIDKLNSIPSFAKSCWMRIYMNLCSVSLKSQPRRD